jgi:hypothetical protein
MYFGGRLQYLQPDCRVVLCHFNESRVYVCLQFIENGPDGATLTFGKGDEVGSLIVEGGVRSGEYTFSYFRSTDNP